MKAIFRGLAMPKVNLPTLTPLQAFKQRWENCTACRLHKVRYNKAVLCRGTYPCDVVFIAEAPGISEDLEGVPMIGPAGNLLDYVISKAIPKHITYSISNLICCIPLDEDGNKIPEPPDECVEACAPRLQEFIELCDPKLIVTVGKPAKDWLDLGYKHSIRLHKRIPLIDIIHPAAILRANQVNQGLEIQKAIIRVRNGVEDHVLGL